MTAATWRSTAAAVRTNTGMNLYRTMQLIRTAEEQLARATPGDSCMRLPHYVREKPSPPAYRPTRCDDAIFSTPGARPRVAKAARR